VQAMTPLSASNDAPSVHSSSVTGEGNVKHAPIASDFVIAGLIKGGRIYRLNFKTAWETAHELSRSEASANTPAIRCEQPSKE